MRPHRTFPPRKSFAGLIVLAMTRVISASILALIFLFADSATARDTEWDHAERDLARIAALVRDAETAIRINSDPVLRTIVCRLGFHRISVGAIARATGVSKRRLLEGVRELMVRGLVNITDADGDYYLLEPTDRDAKAKLQRWAYNWCSNDDRCEAAQ